MADTPDHEHHDPAAAAVQKTGKRQHKDNLVIIGATLASLILLYVVYRSSKSRTGASTGAPSTATLPATQGYVVGSGSAGADSYMQYEYQQMQGALLQNQQAIQAALQGFASYLSAFHPTDAGTGSTAGTQTTPSGTPVSAPVTSTPPPSATSGPVFTGQYTTSQAWSGLPPTGSPIYSSTASSVPGAVAISPTSEWVPGWGGVPDPNGSGQLGGYMPPGSVITGATLT